jgi:predicted Zn-dependent protease
MPAGALMTREQAEELMQKIVKLSKADDINVNLFSGYQTDVRFAANQMSTAGGIMTGGLGVQSTIGKKHAVATTNDLSDESLRAVVEKSEALAKLSPDDPEVMPPLGPQTYLPVNGYFDSTANLTPEARARAALTALDPARKAGDLAAAGFIQVNANAGALGNS